MKSIIVGSWLLVGGFILGMVTVRVREEVSGGVSIEVKKEYPLLKYTIENLAARNDWGSEIILGETEAAENGYVVQKFYFDSDGKRVSGLMHRAEECGRCPVIVQFRGYADVEGYESGYGTKHSAQAFARAGFISLAPDFLGYGESASPSADVFEARFETYTTAMSLLLAISRWPLAGERVGIWGHSNGGQIALSVLAISGKSYPTVLWAPVSAGFPYSILYFMNDNSEGDRLLRKKLVDFENDYDGRLFDFNNYLDRIVPPILWQQGSADKSVPEEWSGALARKLKVEYVVYPGADHNLVPNWNQAVKKDIDFFKRYLK